MPEKKDWKYDTEYISYIESGESAAVFIARDICKAIDTKGKWVDAISFSTYEKRGSEGKRAFNWIVVELFPRKMQPKYDKFDSAHNKYLTWVTAHEDIEKQRENGFHGEKFIILCNLYNKNKNKFTTRTVIAKKYWEPQSAYREMEIKDPVAPDWEYRIQAVKKINSKQVNYIENHEWELEEKIRENGRPILEILGVSQLKGRL